jgi:hypothetical protein
MVGKTPEEKLPETRAVDDWQPPMPPSDLIFDDGEPLETNRHRIKFTPRLAVESFTTVSAIGKR